MRRSIAILGLVTVVGSLGPLVADEPEALEIPGQGWRLSHLDLDITVLPEEETVRVEGTATLLLAADSASSLALSLNSKDPIMRFQHVEAGPEAKVAINTSFPPLPAARVAMIELPETFSSGDELEVSFSYVSSGRGFQFLVSTELAAASWTEAWYPVPADLSGGISLSSLSSAPGTTTFHLPADWHSLSEGEFGGRQETESGVTESWHVSVPVARSFVAGPYDVARHRIGEREVGVYLLSAKPTSAKDQAVALARSIAAMEERFGPFPYPGYGIAEVPEGLFDWYAASQQGFIMAKSTAFQIEGGNIPLFAHEAGHAWWGNLVGTEGPGGILCSESLAQYGAVIALESIRGQEAATDFLRFSAPGYSPLQCARGYFEMAGRGEDKPLSQLESGGWQHNLSDAKGHWVFHMLRSRLGDELFFATLRGLIRDYTGKKMSLNDVRHVFLKAAPAEADLETFLSQWLDREGAPILELEWADASTGGRHRAEVTIRQLQMGDPFRLQAELAIETASGTGLHSIDIAGRESRFVLETDGMPVNVRIDPEHRLLLWTPEYGDVSASLLAGVPQD